MFYFPKAKLPLASLSILPFLFVSTSPSKSQPLRLETMYSDLSYNYYNSFNVRVYRNYKTEQTKKRFLYGLPRSDGFTYDYATLPIYITSDNIEITNQGKKIIYFDNVKVKQGDRTVNARQVIYEKHDNGEETITISSDTELKSNQLVVTGQDLLINNNNRSFSIQKPRFYLVDTILNGSATSIVNDGEYTTFEQPRLWAGPKDSKLSLNITGDSAKLNNQSQKFVVDNSVLRLGNLPIFWMPWTSFNLNADRSHGFLDPTFDISSSNQFSLTVPYFWRIRDDLEYRIRPTYASEYGVLLDNSLLYNHKYGRLGLNLKYAPKLLSTKYDTDRWYLSLNHYKEFDNAIVLDINLKKQSDKYFQYDFFENEVKYLRSGLQLSQNLANHEWRVDIRYFEPIYKTKINTYSSLPELSFKYQTPFAYHKPFYNHKTQVVRFVNPDALYNTANRFYTENGVSFADINKYFSYQLKANTHLVFYNQHNSSTNRYENIVQFSPEMSIELATRFRSKNPVFGHYRLNMMLSTGYFWRQTLSNLTTKHQIYDSALIQPSILNYRYGNYYSSVDRLVNINNLNLAYNLELIDQNTGRQKFMGALGVIQGFKLGLDEKQRNSVLNLSRQLIGEVHYNFLDKYNFDASGLIDISQRSSSTFVASVNYQPSLTNIVQLNYRYVSKQFLQDSLIKNYNKDIQQVGIATIWDVTENLSALASVAYAANEKKLADINIGINYMYYGWAIGTRFERSRSGVNEYSNSYNFNITFLGFNGNYNNRFDRYISSGKLPFTGNR